MNSCEDMDNFSLHSSEGETEGGMYSSEESIFCAWARVYYYSKESRKSYQILPTHCPTYMSTRSTYLYLSTDKSKTFLYLYPDKPGENRKYQSIIKPPIDLRIFNAMRFPESQFCVAMCSRYDGHTGHYVFRLEFLNEFVSQPASLVTQFQRASTSVKRIHNPKYVQKVFKETQQLEEKKGKNVISSYYDALAGLESDCANLVTTFINIVNASKAATKSQLSTGSFSSSEDETKENDDESIGNIFYHDIETK